MPGTWLEIYLRRAEPELCLILIAVDLAVTPAFRASDGVRGHGDRRAMGRDLLVVAAIRQQHAHPAALRFCEVCKTNENDRVGHPVSSFSLSGFYSPMT